jgi:hypothetical protein
MERQPLSNSEGLPRLAKCFLCGTWALASTFKPIAVPDQTGWVEKKACQECLDQILKGEGSKDEGSKTV